jgi:hypothetical protein
VVNGNGYFDVPEEESELPASLAAWLAIEECVSETLDVLGKLGGETDRALAFVDDIHRRVKVWLTWELWASLLDPGHYSPDGLLDALVERGVDVRAVGRWSALPTVPQSGRGADWRAFEDGADGA